MVQPAVRIFTAEQADAAARGLETPDEVRGFEALRAESAAVRLFLKTPEWAAIYARIMGNGKPPTGHHETLGDVSRFLRWTAGGEMVGDVPLDARKAYLHAALEVEKLARAAARTTPVSPAAPAAPVAAAPVSSSSSALGFADALRAVQAGAHIARWSWPSGMYVTMQEGYPQGIGINANTARATGLPKGTVAVFLPYLLRRLPQTAPVVDDGKFVDEPPTFAQWTPGQDDLFATDWRVLTR